MKLFCFLLTGFLFVQPAFSLIETKNKELYQKIEEHFKDKEITLTDLNQFLLNHHYYISEVTQKEDRFFIKNPYEIIFVIRGNRFF